MNIKEQLAQGYEKYKKKDFFFKTFQIILFIWIFSIPLKNSLYQISTILLIILFFIHLFTYKQKNILLNILTIYKKLLILFLLFIASMALSSALGISEKDELSEIFKYFGRYTLVFIVLLYFYKQGLFSRQWLLSVIFVVLCLNSLDGIYQYFLGFDFIANRLPDGPSNLLTGAVYHHNPFGLFMAIGAIMSMVLFFDKKNFTPFKHDKIVYFFALLMFLFTLFHSQSRSAWVMFGLFSTGYLFVYIKNNGIDKKLLYTISSLIVVTVVFFLLDENLSHRLTLLLERNSSGRTSQIWPFAIGKILDSPIFGYGLETYKLLGAPGGHAGVHNLTLEILLYTGLVGFFIYTYIIWLTLKENFSRHTIDYCILFLSFIVLLQFDGSLIDSKVHLNIFILILLFIYSFKLDATTDKHSNIEE